MKDSEEIVEIEYKSDFLWHMPDGTTYEDLQDIVDLGWWVKASFQRKDSPNLVVYMYKDEAKRKNTEEENDK